MRLEGFENVNFEFSESLKKKAEQLLWLLQTYASPEKPRISRLLEQDLNVGGQSIRAMVDYLILECDVPVGSNGQGYWICTNREQAQASARHRKQRAMKGLIVGAALEKMFPPKEQQELGL